MKYTLLTFVAVLMAGAVKASTDKKYNSDQLLELFTQALTAQFGVLSSTQILSLKLIFREWERVDGTDIRKLAYILATAMWESKLTPIREIRAKVGTPLYDQQNTYWNTGYYGRGYVQLTWEKNYRTIANRLNRPELVTNPDLALQPEIAAQIIVFGMYEGLFTGKKLSDYINIISEDYFNARKIVNGLDRADIIAGYSQSILTNLNNLV